MARGFLDISTRQNSSRRRNQERKVTDMEVSQADRFSREMPFASEATLRMEGALDSESGH